MTKKFSCVSCDEKFKKKDHLDRHMVKHTGEKLFICKFEGCDKKYSNKSHLNRHIKKSHQGDLEVISIPCQYDGCLKFFSSQCNANRHYQTHHVNLYPYSCQDCDKAFRRKLQLKKHIVLQHTGDFPLRCRICEAGFIKKASLLRHMRKNHESTCKNCTKTFPNWSQLVKHRRDCQKSARQEFLCDLCDKAFTRKPNIKEHMKLHQLNQTVFQCHYENCSKFYTAKRNLTSHIRSKHEGKRWMCDYCNQEKSTKQKLVQHLKAHINSNNYSELKNSRHISAFWKIIPPDVQNLSPSCIKSFEEIETSCAELSD